MMQFKKGLGWKACYDEERNLYTAQTSWRGDYHLYEINSEIWSQLGEPGVDSDKLIHSGRHLYYSQDSPIGPPTDMVIDENYAELGTWTNIRTSGNAMSEELTDAGGWTFAVYSHYNRGHFYNDRPKVYVNKNLSLRKSRRC